MPSYAWGYGNQDMVGAVGGKAESGVLPAVALLKINAMRFSYFLAWMLAMLGIGHFSYRSFNWLLIVSLIKQSWFSYTPLDPFTLSRAAYSVVLSLLTSQLLPF
jgi:hypothetical protein